MHEVGLVAIGRNEGERLRRCLESARGLGLAVVYVDSGSSDGSVEAARGLGAEVVELDLSSPFTAARARNAGLARLLEAAPEARHVQFIDGDCELAPGWIERGRAELDARPDVAVVAGRLRERRPDRSVYNRMADLEWDVPPGDVEACGGIAMMRVAPLVKAGGYDPSLMAGEEPELCLRLRRDGWKVVRLADDMASHDMEMTRFRQWWRRAVRCGYAYAEGASLHGGGPERHYVRETRSILAWGLALPAVALALAWPTRGLSLLLLGAYAILAARVYRYNRRRRPAGDAAIAALFIVPAKLAGIQGMARYWAGRLSGRRGRLIEYRGPAASPPSP
ncbi:glycosyltransferase [Paludisphaera sp.]|uniref:glycosyltransferase n=1 Tax=Paludisphaera sp. TaxID=2017432 RepID=UPI00301D7BFE